MRYFFDVFEGHGWARDDLGIDCRDDRAARHQAVLALTEMAREYLPQDGPNLGLRVRVRKGEETAFTVRLEFDTEAGPALVDPAVATAQRPHQQREP